MTISLLEQLPWRQLAAVQIRTTSDGPFAEDVFWHFVRSSDEVLELPGALVGDAELAVIGRHLPDLAWAAVIGAMGCTEDQTFLVWTRAPAPRVPPDGLPARFAALVERLGGRAAAAPPVYERLRAAWSAPARRYHDLRHLTDCLQELDGAAAPRAAHVELALWYHDAVYEAGATDCEARSAQLLLDDAEGLAIPGEAARIAAQLVRATAHLRGAAPREPATDLMLDIDLAILGRDPAEFQAFEAGIVAEYAAFPAAAFYAARGRFLASLLASPHIYRTAWFRVRYERAAREHITALLATEPYRALAAR